MHKSIIVYLLLIIANVFVSRNIIAQEVYSPIKPIKSSKSAMFTYNTLIYAGGSIMDLGSIYTSTNNSDNFKRIYSSYINVGVYNELWYDKYRLCLSAGFMSERLSTNMFYSENGGVYLKWISADFNIVRDCVMLGVSTDLLLDCYSKSTDDFTYVGYNTECFNNASFYWYFGAMFRLYVFRIEGRLGSYLIPHIDINKLAYYNSTKTSVDELYFEIRVAYRIFTTGKIFDIN